MPRVGDRLITRQFHTRIRARWNYLNSNRLAPLAGTTFPSCRSQIARGKQS
jgi:hypothetical protein